MKRRSGFTPLENALTGFTLLELIISSAIFLVVVLTIYSAFYAGVFGYHDIEENINTFQIARQIFERINSDLRNSVIYAQNETMFNGTNNAISFSSLTDRFSEDKIIQDYALISYKLEDKKLMRICLKNQEILTNSSSQAQEEEMDSNIEELSFSYGYIPEGKQAIEWKDSWDDPAALPAAVKVKLTLKNKIKQDFQRTIFLPL